MTAKLQQWGNSLAVRLPKGLVYANGLQKNDVVELIGDVDDIKIVKLSKSETFADLLAIGRADSLSLSAEDSQWLKVPRSGAK